MIVRLDSDFKISLAATVCPAVSIEIVETLETSSTSATATGHGGHRNTERNNNPTSAAALSRWPLDEAGRCVAVQCCNLLLVPSTTP